MKYDIFFSICQTDVDGYTPSERVMYQNFFDQARLADALGYGTAWIAETHLSCQVQKENPGAVIPHFEGEIGLNTDIFQMAHILFNQTKNLSVGSAILNIQCNGGPLARAEAVKTALSLHGVRDDEERLLEIGFAAGRFAFSNVPYGIWPRTPVEAAAWPALRGQIFKQATEIFLRAIRGDVFSSDDIEPITLTRANFRSDEDWDKVLHAHGRNVETIQVPHFWTFPRVGVIPFEPPLHLLRLTIGAHDAPAQIHANQYMPCGVFNLSITPAPQIEAAHERMETHFHPDGGKWHRGLMPRTTLVFPDDTPGLSDEARDAKAREVAGKALENYWSALAGTVDPQKIEQAVDNALVGSVNSIRRQLEQRFHEDDRLMLWFDFNNHDNEQVKANMRLFMEKIAL